MATPETYQQISRIYPINIPDGETDLILAVRIPFVPFGLDAYTGFFAHRTFFLGERSDLISHLDLWNHAMLFERIPMLVDAGLKILLALFLLALFWTQQDHPNTSGSACRCSWSLRSHTSAWPAAWAN
jgi:hypothetical protein